MNKRAPRQKRPRVKHFYLDIGQQVPHQRA